MTVLVVAYLVLRIASVGMLVRGVTAAYAYEIPALSGVNLKSNGNRVGKVGVLVVRVDLDLHGSGVGLACDEGNGL